MNMLEHHRDLLKSSAISPEIIADRGYESVETKARLKDAGFRGDALRVPSLLIPVYNELGEVALYQHRPDDPRRGRDGRPIKYETPSGAKMAVDVPPRIRQRLADPSIPLWITEGVRKADSAVSAGLVCVALLGVWNWRGRNKDAGLTALAFFESVALKGRKVFLTFDSDVMTKPEVHASLVRLGALLARRGAEVAYVYLPSANGAKVGLDDFLANGGKVEELVRGALNAPVRNPSDSPVTLPPPPADAPALAADQRILDRFKVAVKLRGVVGEVTTACLTYLTLTSRLLDEQASLIVKGHSSSGKSYTVEQTVKFFPSEGLVVWTAMSERALVFSTEEYAHRTLVLYEAAALREGQEDNQTAYFLRSLLSEGRINYEVTIKGGDGGFTTKTITKEGPTNVIITTTKVTLEAENETRMLSITTDDSRAQTGRVLASLANERNGDGPDLTEWVQLQRWLAGAEHRVTIPYAAKLAEKVPPVAVRLRRDFRTLLSLIRAHAILHQQTRDRDEGGRIVATLDDYAVVRELVDEILSSGVGQTVSSTVRETVAAVKALTPTDKDEATAQQVAVELKLDKSAARRRLVAAARDGYIRNLEDHRGRPGRWRVGEPLPGGTTLLPAASTLATTETAGQEGGDGGGGTVAGDPEGKDDGESEGVKQPADAVCCTESLCDHVWCSKHGGFIKDTGGLAFNGCKYSDHFLGVRRPTLEDMAADLNHDWWAIQYDRAADQQRRKVAAFMAARDEEDRRHGAEVERRERVSNIPPEPWEDWEPQPYGGPIDVAAAFHVGREEVEAMAEEPTSPGADAPLGDLLAFHHRAILHKERVT
jgi:hypothetical protein